MSQQKIVKPRHKKTKISSSEISKDLENIYENDNGKISDISRLDPVAKRGFLNWLIGAGVILLILAGISWLGFWAFNSYAPDNIKKAVSDSGDIEIEIVAPDKIDSNEEIIYLIKYKNKKKVGIKNISLNVRYPSGLLIDSSDPEPKTRDDSLDYLTREDNWNLGDLAKGESGEITIKGRLIAEEGVNQILWIIFYYEPENFSSRFQKEASQTTFIKSSPLSLNIEGTEQIITSDQVELNLKYANETNRDLINILIKVDYPQDFSLEEMEPKAKEDSDNQWTLPVLEKGEAGEIKIKGKFATNISGNQDFIVQAFIKEDEDNLFLLAEIIHTVAVISGELLVELKINSSSEDGTVNFGDTLSYSLTYQNNGDDILESLEATVFFTSTAEFIQWTTLNDRYGGLLDEFEAGKILTWTEEDVPNLAKLKSGEKGVIDFSVKIMSNAGEMSGDLNLQNVALVRIGTIDDEEINLENKSNTVITKLNSNLSLFVYGRYFNEQGVSVGSGPVPPRAGQTTRHVIFWQLNNSVHEIGNIVVSTVLPEAVTWSGQQEITAGELKYQPETHEVIWSLNRMPTTIDLDYRVGFGVSVTPGSTDIGKILALTGDNSLVATDQVTGAKIIQAGGAITTDLVTDPVAKGKGLVEE